uniref:Uncharacterized protein n=1 Tax=Ralstonia solanacearum TaxID=305 RepID=A0A0S4UY81_RALSL|nr:protein of unknown function [Ralstonia solanacearum]
MRPWCPRACPPGRPRIAPADTLADTTAASASDDVDAPDLMVEIDAALRYTEQGALDLSLIHI